MKSILTGLIAVLVAACGQSSEPHVEETIDDVWHKAKLRGVAWRFARVVRGVSHPI